MHLNKMFVLVPSKMLLCEQKKMHGDPIHWTRSVLKVLLQVASLRDCFKSQKDETADEATAIISFRHLQHQEPGG